MTPAAQYDATSVAKATDGLLVISKLLQSNFPKQNTPHPVLVSHFALSTHLESHRIMSTAPSAQRPPIRRVVTGHTPEGKAIVADDVAIHPRPFGGPSTSLIADVFWTDSFPSDNSGEFKDSTKEHVKDFLSPNGTVFRVVDIPPGGVSVSRVVCGRYEAS